MLEDTRQYSADRIYPFLDRALFASFSTRQGAEIDSRFMVFACDPQLQFFYFLTLSGSDKIQELRENPRATVSILSPGDGPEDYAETIVFGLCTLPAADADEAAQNGLKLLAAKSERFKMLIEKGLTDAYQLISLKSQRISFRIYQDILNDLPKTILRF